jgi:hypothetical protein
MSTIGYAVTVINDLILLLKKMELFQSGSADHPRRLTHQRLLI